MNDSLFDDIRNYLRTTTVEDTEEKSGGVLEPEEYEKLLIALAQTRGNVGFSEEEAITLIRWAEQIVVGKILLDFILDDMAAVDIQNGEPVFMITERGREIWETNR